MRASNWLISTAKETPADAEIASHQLMLRAGLIRKLGSGLYTWMPMGLKVLRNVERIVREEMNHAGAMELLMPAVQPAELWHETGRWDTFGGQLLKMRDNNDREYCYGPTHEEVITDVMRRELNSYKQLPVNLYQIQTKFRDEIRPRFGVMRAREFIMKDAYSFHLDEQCLEKTYDAMYQAYGRCFDRMGLQYRAVEADTGAIGGAKSHEFQVLADSGEDLIFYSDVGTYAANIEQATCKNPEPVRDKQVKQIELIDTPNVKTMQDLADFMGNSVADGVKTLIVKGREHPLVALIIKGDDELNEVKASKHPWVLSPMQLASEDEIIKTIGAPPGSIGPVGLNIPFVVDHHAYAMAEFNCGANQTFKHYQHAVWDRDVSVTELFDLRNVKEGDISPDGLGHLKMCRGIEVGHVFQLGDKYAKAMNATVLDEQGRQRVLSMGCYGLGISRVVAAAIEQHHDDKGIIWPQALAPFQVVLIPLNIKRDESVRDYADSLYQELISAGIDVLLDDRQERPGVLFAEHDLIGIPHRIVIGSKGLTDGMIEYKRRGYDDVEGIKIADAASRIKEILI